MHADVPNECQALAAQLRTSQAALHAAQARASRLARIYSALTRCNRAIVHSRCEEELFEHICRIAVDSGGLAMAWIGRTAPHSSRVRPIASFGDKTGYLDTAQASTEASTTWGYDPTGTAIREQQAIWHPCVDDVAAPLWRTHATQAGWTGCAALPLFQNGKAIGALTLHARTAHFFDQDAQQLLVEMASDVSCALDNFTHATQHTHAGRALRDNESAIDLATGNARTALEQLELQHYRNHLERQKYVLDQHAIVTTCGVDGRITYGNAKFSETSGFSPEEFMGRDHNIVNSGRHPHGFFKHMYATIARGGVWHGEVCNRAKDGHEYWVDSTVAAFMGEDGKPREYIAVRTDITERKRIEEAAHAANRAKSEFLANISHEIRTPMNGMLGMVDVLQATDLAPSQRRMLDTIHNSSLALLSILNDILDFSKIEADKLELESIPTQLREVAEGVAQLLVTNSASRSVELSVFVSPELPRWILGDPNRLRQVLLNLLGNALKFTHHHEERPARVVLYVEPCVQEDGTLGVRLRVVDNGIGMSPQVQALLFQPFTQADASTARKFGGTGLGLSITQRLVEMMQGRISVHSSLGQGSEFTVELPLQPAEPGRSLPADPKLTGVRLLLVTTDAHTLLAVPAYCGSAGAQVAVVASLAAIRQHLHQTPWAGPTVVLLGLDVTPPLQSLGLPTPIGVVRLVRSSSDIAAREIAVLARPLLYHDLIHGVALASGRLSAVGQRDPLERRHQSERPQAPSIMVALQTQRLILLAEDNETNRDVMREQLRLLGYATEVAENGAMALEMWRSGRYALLLTDCHMPVMDGFELTQAIRQAEPQGTRLPIIAVTANAMQGEAERCRARGMDDYLSKPLRLKEVGPMLAKWLPLAPVGGPEPATVWDALALRKLVGDNPAMHRRLLEKFLANAHTQVAAMGSAATAGEPAKLTEVAHTLKSAARSVGALALGELCQALETAGRAGDLSTCSALSRQLEPVFSAAAQAIQTTLG
ncbi:MAG: hypothetical protein A3F78_19070 [Burkholderiales bacterium RIFCSPLOWO2_12_FULL_61_40]|nr:MAG: hypothetical protein A3F78_19070 [Burkholderiales bacterium RIFCSPLOWO2_12_FULL_61_40]